jgi:hypothetical protein
MSFSGIRAFFTDSIADWRDIRFSELQFWRRGDARVMLIALIALVVVLLIARSSVTRRAGRHRIVLPALPASIARSRLAFLAHTPLVFFVVGLFFFALALGDPYTSLVK